MSASESSRPQRVRATFDEVLSAPPEDRLARLRELTADAPEIRADVEALLAAEAAAGSFLERGPGAADLDNPSPELLGRRIGPYEVVREIGRGGMGTVFLGVRADDQYRKQVAIKVVRAALDRDPLDARFARERQILASLDHPDIARLVDAGTTASGLPYLVMDYVDGTPIDEYCERERLSIDARLALMRRVCEAVHYAHRHLVVHRDLKPRNILVTADGSPRLLDFGIAKLLSADTGEAALPGTSGLTETGLRVMTPEYASPEQARGEPTTTAADVYALGIILFQLLTGQRPYRWTTSRLDEIVRTICDTPAPRPSSVAPAATSRELRGDLDAIVLTALRKEPERRYASANQLSEDIRLYLAGHPITARTDAWRYRVSKFARRHRVGVGAAALVAVSLVSGLGVAIWQANIARAERRIAEAQRERAERRFRDVRQLANSFLFKFHDAIAPLPGSTPARKLVVSTALEYLDSLATEASDDTGLQEELAAAYDKVGDVQGSPTAANLGDTTGALASYRKAETIRKALTAGAPNDADARERLGVSAVKIADALIGRGELKAAVTQYQAVRAVREDALKLSPSRVSIRAGLAEVTGRLCTTLVPIGDVKGALENCARNADLLRSLLRDEPNNPGARTWSTQLVLNGIATGNAQRLSGDPKTAAATLQQTVTAIEGTLAKSGGGINADLERRLAVAYAYLANAQADLQDLRGASASYGGAVDKLSRLAALDPANTRFRTDLVYMLTKRGELLAKTGDLATARQATSRALSLQRESALRPDAPPDVLNDYAWALVSCLPEDLRQPAVALTFAKRAVSASSDPNPIHLHTLAWAEFRTGQAQAAVANAERALSAMSAAPGPATGLRKQIEADLATFRAGTR